jgi:hypothetical protein
MVTKILYNGVKINISKYPFGSANPVWCVQKVCAGVLGGKVVRNLPVFPLLENNSITIIDTDSMKLVKITLLRNYYPVLCRTGLFFIRLFSSNCRNIYPPKNVPKQNKTQNVRLRNTKHNKKRLAGQDTSLDAFKRRLQAFLLVLI